MKYNYYIAVVISIYCTACSLTSRKVDISELQESKQSDSTSIWRKGNVFYTGIAYQDKGDTVVIHDFEKGILVKSRAELGGKILAEILHREHKIYQYVNNKRKFEYLIDKDRTYELDNNGYRIYTMADNIEILQIKTGFYYSYSYRPMVIIKCKNISGYDISNTVKLKYVFTNIDTNEEWGSSYENIHYSYQVPWKVNSIKQIALEADRIVSYYSNYNIKCDIYIEDTFIKTVRIKKTYLATNTI